MTGAASTSTSPRGDDGLDIVRLSVKSQISAALKLTRWLTIPQIIVLAMFCLTFAVIAVWGIVHSVTTNGQRLDFGDLKSLIPYLSTGSSGILGAIIIPLLKRLNEMSRDYLEQEKKYARAIALADNEATRQKILDALKAM